MKPDISKFSLSEAHNDSNGKSSNSKYNGTKIITTGCITLLVSSIGMLLRIPESVTIAGFAFGAITSGAALSGYSKKKGAQNQLSSLTPKNTE